jgi:sugar transferase EpsL
MPQREMSQFPTLIGLVVRLPKFNTIAKRLFDLLLAALAVIMLSPLLLFTAGLVFLRFGCPVFFRQRRTGLHGHSFEIWKFRTMVDAGYPNGEFLPDELRLTRFGQFLRRSSLDELPQLFNVLQGNMSLVGPRPLLPEYLPRYNDFQKRRHEVKPGITGWAQVNGRNTLTWDQKFKLDVWYVDHWNIWLDIKILWMTVITTVRSEGINQVGRATVSEFTGSSNSDETACEN